MTRERDNLVKEIFANALEHEDTGVRCAYLDVACAGDLSLRQTVETLLQSYTMAGAFLEDPAAPACQAVAVASELLTEKPGDRIGPYKLLQQVGQGGCGAVYMAEQTEPIRRRVALKVIKLGMDTRQVIGCFEVERQALALMDHPNIAKVFDAGATDTGRPYFVMELVRGIPITDYCDQNNLSTEQRLGLFVQVCHAIQHAHQKGIIHRDIKPSNILVTIVDGQAVPKVIDFGIAKATGGQILTDKTLFTAFEQFIGTPAYMSPEQAALSGVDVDTRSDIYSLGVLLYELLTGLTPFDRETLAKAALDEVRRMIRETEPPKPSTRLHALGSRLAEVAQQRHSEPATLQRQLRGDLDWIIMKCLEKDRRRRYETANNVATDLEHHLRHEPVSAAAPGAVYRLQKFARRHKTGITMAGAAALMLTAGVLVSTWQAVRASRAEAKEKLQRQRAEAEASKRSQVARFLTDALQGVGPSVALGRDTKILREILDQTADRVGKELSGQPEVEADLRRTLGEVYLALGQHQEAEVMLRQALTLHTNLYGLEDAAVADALLALASVHYAQAKLDDAEALNRQALSILNKLPQTNLAWTGIALCNLANVLDHQGRLAEAAAMQQRALAIKTNAFGLEHPEVADSLGNLAGTFMRAGKPVEAEPLERQALEIRRKVGNPVRVAVSLDNLGNILRRQGKLKEAENALRESIAVRRRVYSADHPDLALGLNNLGSVLFEQGNLEEAEKTYRAALEIDRKALGNHPSVAVELQNLAGLLVQRKDLSGAEDLVREALAIVRAAHGNDHPDVTEPLEKLGFLLELQGRLEESEKVARECLEIRERTAPDNWATFKARYQLGGKLVALKRFADAEPLLLSGYEGLKQREQRIPAGSRRHLVAALQRLVELYEAWGKPGKAAEWKLKLAGAK